MSFTTSQERNEWISRRSKCVVRPCTCNIRKVTRQDDSSLWICAEQTTFTVIFLPTFPLKSRRAPFRFAVRQAGHRGGLQIRHFWRPGIFQSRGDPSDGRRSLGLLAPTALQAAGLGNRHGSSQRLLSQAVTARAGYQEPNSRVLREGFESARRPVGEVSLSPPLGKLICISRKY